MNVPFNLEWVSTMKLTHSRKGAKRLKKVVTKLRERRGDFAVEHAWGLLFAVAVLLSCISVLGVVSDGNDLDTIASDLTRQIEIAGQVNYSDVNTQLAELSAAAGLENVTVSIDANYLDAGTRKIQFGDDFIVTLSYTAYLDFGGVISIPVPLNSSVVGRSERYWKS